MDEVPDERLIAGRLRRARPRRNRNRPLRGGARMLHLAHTHQRHDEGHIVRNPHFAPLERVSSAGQTNSPRQEPRPVSKSRILVQLGAEVFVARGECLRSQELDADLGKGFGIHLVGAAGEPVKGVNYNRPRSDTPAFPA